MLRKLPDTVSLLQVFGGLVVFMLIWRIPYYGKLVLDDPFITFRYGFNLVHHGQFVFNPGELVLATTTPVYGLLMTGAEWLRLPVVWTALLFNLVCEAALLYVLGRMIMELLPRHWLLAYAITGLLTITNRAISIASNSGMETPLFILLNMLALLWIMRARYLPAAVVGSLATLTRPDGVFVLIVLAVTIVIRERRLPLRETGLSLLIGLPWLVIATLTYGHPIPQSVLAKSAVVQLWETMKLRVVFYEPLRFFGLLALPPLLVALRCLFRDRHQSLPLLLLLALNLIYMALPSNLGFDWYFGPLYTLLNMLVGLGLVWLWDTGRLTNLLAKICTVGVLVGVAYSSVGNYASAAEIDRIWRDGMLRAVDYLNSHAAADAVVQCTNIGILAYYTGLNVLDPLGIASPEATALMDDVSSLGELYRNTAAAFQPDYIVSFGPEAYAGYEPVAEFPTSTVAIIIYRRAETAFNALRIQV